MIEGIDFPGLLHKINRLNERTWNEYTKKTCYKQQLINQTGHTSIYGELIEACTSCDQAADLCAALGNHCIGAVYEAGIVVGGIMWVVIYGSAQVLLEDGTLAVHGNWAATGGPPDGRADCSAADPAPAFADHMKEIGHVMETVGAGTDVLCEINMHFN